MHNYKNILKGKYFLVFFITVIAAVNFSYHFQTRTNDRFESDRIESAKQAWGDLLASNIYYNRPHKTKEEWKKIPQQDRPDLAFELDFMMTMDPALGNVPYERQYEASRYVDKLLKDRAAIPNVNWTEKGPNNVGGRSRSIMFDPNDATHKKVWAGGVGGGLWYTIDITEASPVWNKVDDFWDNIAVTAIAFDPNNTQNFYVGTGEGWFNGDGQRGTGIWKSSNGGSTWTSLPSTLPGAYNSSSDFHYIQKIVVKSNGNIFAATRGYYINRGGIMRSANGGSSWTRVLSVYAAPGGLQDRASDIEVAANGDLFCSFGNHSEGRVFKSTNTNNGNIGTWTDLSSGIEMGNAERVELACAPSDANVIYAVAEGGSGDNDVEWFKKSIDGGTTWSALTIPKLVDDGTTHFTRGQAWYDLIVAVHPANPDLVLAGGVDLHRSINGGTSWSGISHWNGGFSKPYVHADQHAIVFRPETNNEVIFTNDGGIFLSANAGNADETPVFSAKINGYNVTQFYACAAKNEVNGNFFLAGSQDNGTQRFTQPQKGNTTLATSGDGGFCHIDQNVPNLQLTSYIYNKVYRSLNGGISFNTLFTETTGFFINPSDYDSGRKILYATSNDNLLKRVTGLDSTITNTDLSVDLGSSKVSALKVSPYNDIVFLGIANGRIYKFENASSASPTLTRIDNGSTPITTTGWVSSIDVGADDNQLLVTYSNYGVISVWQTTDGGAHWYNKEGNLPDIPIRWAIYNPDNREQVLAATELGVWTTGDFHPNNNSAPVWGPGNAGLAHTRCNMIKYRPADKLVAIATHGRGLFTSDIFVTNPIADFIFDVNASCNGSLTVQFTDSSLKPNGSWAWDIDHNGTTDYTTQNPTHTYASPGLYSVKLTTNSGNTSTTKENSILVMNNPPAINTGCTLNSNSNSGNSSGIGIVRFAVGYLDKSSLHNDGFYQNYVCTLGTPMKLNTTYPVTICTGVYNNEGARYYIDYNDNAIFEANESVISFPANTDGLRTISFTTPSSGIVTNKCLRSRVLSCLNAVPTNACNIGTYGQAEDYTVYFKCHLMVTLNSGDNEGSLPAAINCANPGDTIRLSAALAGQTINVGTSSLFLNKNLVIIADASNISITGSVATVFDIMPGVTVGLSGMNIIAGTSLTAGAINNSGVLTLTNVSVHRNPNITDAILLRNSPGGQITTFGICFIQQ